VIQIRCPRHGVQSVEQLPATCPGCLTDNKQVNVDCPNHGLQVVNSALHPCPHCVTERALNRPMHRMFHRQDEPIIGWNNKKGKK
jgi:hypothetical protein